MGPFIEKIKRAETEKLPKEGAWAFLNTYDSPIVEENLEKISKRGKDDAFVSAPLPLCPLLRHGYLLQ